jgi:HEAT repeat protein
MARDSGARLKQEVMELGARKGPEVLTGLVAAAGNSDKEVRQMALALLSSQMSAQGIEFVQKGLKDDKAEVRRSAARAAAKFTSLAGDLIGLLSDPDGDAADAAHQSLVKISGGEDFGPSSRGDVEASRQKWQAWWDKERGK